MLYKKRCLSWYWSVLAYICIAVAVAPQAAGNPLQELVIESSWHTVRTCMHCNCQLELKPFMHVLVVERLF